MYVLGSGDWISLSEAASLCCEILGSRKTEEDVLKLGYLEYKNVGRCLRIYTFARQPLVITAAEPSEELKRIAPNIGLEHKLLTDTEKLATRRNLIAGDVFELNPEILERLTLLRHWWSGAGASAVIRARWYAELPGWKQHTSNEIGQPEYWSAVFDGTIAPEIEILWDDLRVDRQELTELLDEVKQDHAPNPKGDVLGKPQKAKKDLESELDTRERRTLLIMVAALAKEAKAPIDSPTKTGDLIEKISTELGQRVSSRTAQSHLNRIPGLLGEPTQIKH